MKNEHPPRPALSGSLRNRAEAVTKPPANGTDPARTLHELQVHQVELEMQNDELRRVQDALLAAKKRYFELYDQSPSGYVTVDRLGFISEGNLAFSRMVGVERNHLISLPFARFIHPDDQADYYILRHRLELGSEHMSWEMRMIHANGSAVWTHFDASPTEGGESRITLTNISSLKETSEQLVRAIRQTEIANDAKSEFLANMSHEIRTPLNGIMGAVQLLQQSSLDEEQRKLADMAMRSGKRLTELLSDILDISKLEAGRTILNEVPFRSAALFDAIKETFEPISLEKEIPLLIDVSHQVPEMLVGDEVRIRQILFNLVGNALKFTERGQVEVTARAILPAERGQLLIHFTVKDSGIGIAKHLLGCVCEPFVQVSGILSRSYQGAGLGLAISKRLVSAMRGTLSIVSEQGKGTTVSVVLPLVVSTGSHLSPPSLEGRLSSVLPLRILAVEDDAINLMALELALKKMGHNVVSATTGKAALEALVSNDFDCVLMDVQMPEMDGITTTLNIRRGAVGPEHSAVPIIAMTGFALEGDRERFLKVGMTEYISKPIDFADLNGLLEKVCRTR